MKTIAIVKYVFALIGTVLLIAAIYAYQETRTFVASASRTTGTVTGYSGNRPIVRFKDERGTEVQFTSSTGSSPPRYRVGEAVAVLYQPAAPYDAKIEGFFALWGVPVIIGGIGSVFFLIGAGIMAGGRLKSRRDAQLRSTGVPIQTEFQSVELNTFLQVNGRHPFRVFTQWKDPATSLIHVFHSNNLWFDPTQHVERGRRITVYIEAGNPRRYFMDVSFLPQLAD
jgi:hypothetical protein